MTRDASDDQNERATTKPVRIPTVLAVGCSDALLSRCWEAISGMGLMVRDCEPARAATLAAQRAPLAIVVPSAVYAQEPEELEALARDIRTTLIRIDDDTSAKELAAAVTQAIRVSTRRRVERGASGRYSILPGELVAMPGLVRTDPPPVSAVRPAEPTLPSLDEIDVDLQAINR